MPTVGLINMSYCIGLTGNIACGKSTVASLFGHLGVTVFDADTIAKQLTLEGTEAYNEIKKHFGSQILKKDKQLNRKKLRQIIFSQASERRWLEQLLHPRIRHELSLKVNSSPSIYSLVEIPLLKDKKDYPYIKRVLLVMSPLMLQVERLRARDQCSEKQALAIIETQPNIAQRLAQADDLLINAENLSELQTDVERLNIQYLNYAKNI